MNFKDIILKDWKLFRSVAFIDIAAFSAIIISLIANYLGPNGNFVVVAGLIGDKIMTGKIIGIAFLIILINSWLSFIIFRKERLLAWFLALAGLAVSVLCLIKVASVVYFW